MLKIKKRLYSHLCIAINEMMYSYKSHDSSAVNIWSFFKVPVRIQTQQASECKGGVGVCESSSSLRSCRGLHQTQTARYDWLWGMWICFPILQSWSWICDLIWPHSRVRTLGLPRPWCWYCLMEWKTSWIWWLYCGGQDVFWQQVESQSICGLWRLCFWPWERTTLT